MFRSFFGLERLYGVQKPDRSGKGLGFRVPTVFIEASRLRRAATSRAGSLDSGRQAPVPAIKNEESVKQLPRSLGRVGTDYLVMESRRRDVSGTSEERTACRSICSAPSKSPTLSIRLTQRNQASGSEARQHPGDELGSKAAGTKQGNEGICCPMS